MLHSFLFLYAYLCNVNQMKGGPILKDARDTEGSKDGEL